MAPIFYMGIGTLTALTIVWLGVRLHSLRRLISTKCSLVELILKNIDAYVVLIDEKFDVQMTNFYTLTGICSPCRLPRAGNLLRCKNGEDAGLCGLHELCSGCAMRTAAEKAFQQRKGFSKLELSMQLYTSAELTATEEREFSVSGSYLDIDGKPGLLLTLHNITAQKQVQRELERACIRAEKADRTKTIFLTNTSHEFRTPLNAILGFSELLGGGIAIRRRDRSMFESFAGTATLCCK